LQLKFKAGRKLSEYPAVGIAPPYLSDLNNTQTIKKFFARQSHHE